MEGQGRIGDRTGRSGRGILRDGGVCIEGKERGMEGLGNGRD